MKIKQWYLGLALSIFIQFVSFNTFGQELSYYLPNDVSYNSDIPTPKSVIGHEVGEWHVTHDKLVYYMQTLAKASPRLSIKKFGETFEGRPLLLLTITNPDNHANIEAIKKEHYKLTDSKTSKEVDIANAPAVAYLGYSVHGNEPSGSNAALVLAYYLAAAQGDAIESLLKETVILLDPSLNPDGLNRFASWVNTHKSHVTNGDPNHMEFNEMWPGGRTNHYWFDLNRDWLPVQLPESQGRIRNFHEWKPNVLTDHHEMGTNSTFFFQPGIPSRNHPLTPQKNFDLTKEIAGYHAKYLDKIGSLYYSQESFDDFYYGKGSTFPDANGGIGILFEQASSRGHAQESIHGLLRFPFTIRNHFTTSLSTLKAVQSMRVKLLTYQKEFFINAAKEAKSSATKAFVFGNDKDIVRSKHLIAILNQHEIKVNKLAKEVTRFKKENSYIVSTDQKQSKLIHAIFEKRTSFKDSLFYDISAWTLPLAFNLDFESVDAKTIASGVVGEEITDLSNFVTGSYIGPDQAYAYVFEWHRENAANMLQQLLKKNLIAKVATFKFKDASGQSFDRGTIMVPAKNQVYTPKQIHQLMVKSAQEFGIEVKGLATGFTSGYNLGSPTFTKVNAPSVLLISGPGTSSYEVGEVWHLFDQRLKMPISLVPIDAFNRTDLNRYNTIVMVNGSYGKLNQGKLKTWLQKGGTLISTKGASKWLSDKKLSKATYKKSESFKFDSMLPYDLQNRYEGAQALGGAIFEAEIDLSHPLAFGLTRNTMSLFRNHRNYMEKDMNPFGSPIRYTDNPLLSGYISDNNLDLLKGTPAVRISSYGSGKMISFADNMNFRAFWRGTSKVFVNAVFFGNVIRSRSGR